VDLARAVGLVCLAIVGVVTARMATGGVRIPRRSGDQSNPEDDETVLRMDPMGAALVLLATLLATLVVLFTAR
jgi:hypothetical protein